MMTSSACLNKTENSFASEDDVNSCAALSQPDIKPPIFYSNPRICSNLSLDTSAVETAINGTRVKCFSPEHLKSENVDDQLCDTFVAVICKQEPVAESDSKFVAKDEEVVDEEDTETEEMQNPSCKPNVENIAAACKLTSTDKSTSWRRKTKVQCTKCTFQSTSSEKLKVHVKVVHEPGESYCCCLCSFESKWNKEYYDHMRTHYPGPPYQCDFENCTAKCFRIQHLLYHRMNHTEERPFSCCLCSLTFRNKSNMVVHMRKHTGYSPFTCKECSRSFSTKGALHQHVVTHSDKRTFLCDQCVFTTKHRSHLISHRRLHAGDALNCQLENCSYKTTKRSQLLQHMQSHLRIKTFFCEQCEQGFITKSHLKRHQLIHSAIKPFACDYCDYSSNRKDKLRLHVMKHHAVNSNLASNAWSKPRTVHSSRNPRYNELGVPEVDNDAMSCEIYQKMVQKVDEQLNYRRLTKYVKVPHAELGNNCIDSSIASEVQSAETVVVVDQPVLSSRPETLPQDQVF